ncbi:hypothetical protein TWF481_001924 [Arthrobotrys musiformis]|uniref:F-box domain-containing protein n=1 Tax=Arthrobotrys musiformis TaxID=47236 RepID=A0AAV9VUX2_9PEZI
MASAATPCLVSVLSNNLIFNLIIPRIPIQSLLALLSTSHAIRSLLKSSPDTFRYLDFTSLPIANVDRTPLDRGGISWRAERMDEALTEEEFFSGPLRGIFYSLKQLKILQNVSTLILDEMPVTIDILEEIMLDTTGNFNVRILSVRECFFKSNHPRAETKKIFQLIESAVTRPKPPRLKALYLFGAANPATYFDRVDERDEAEQLLPGPVKHLPEDPWYLPLGTSHRPIIQSPFWFKSGFVKTMENAEGVMKFDFILCRGPSHDPRYSEKRRLADLASFPLGFGCMNCGTSPEGPGVYGKTPSGWLPLLAPPPITTSSVEAACRPPIGPDGKYPELYARCFLCIIDRRCVECRKWICENCAKEGEVAQFIANFAEIEAGLVPTEYLHGVVYDPEKPRSPRTYMKSARLCLEKCMIEAFG